MSSGSEEPAGGRSDEGALGDLGDAIDLQSVSGHPQAVADRVGSATGIQQRYDPTPAQEQTRGWIAVALLVALFVVILFLMTTAGIIAVNCSSSQDKCVSSKETLNIITTVMNIMFTPLIGLVGTVIGFYFGSKASNGN